MGTLLQVLIPVLELHLYTDAGVAEYAGNRFNDLTLNEESFPGLTPTVAQLNTKLIAYNLALGKTEHGTPSETEAKNKARTALERTLTQMADNCAEIADGNVELYLKSGFSLKTKGAPHTTVLSPSAFTFTDGPTAGSLYITFKGVKYKQGYEVRISQAGSNPDTWTTVMFVSSGRKRILVSDLSSGVRYYCCVRTLGTGKIVSGWSNTASRVVQ